MSFCLNEGTIKVIQKIFLTAITAHLYWTISSIIPSCSLTRAGWHIYPFDKTMFTSSILFLSSAAITIVECDVWPYNTQPRNRLLQFLGEVSKIINKVLNTINKNTKRL